MKNIISAVLIATSILLVSSVSFAKGFYANLTWADSYVIGTGFRVSDKPVVQTEVGYDSEGLGGSVWNSIPASFSGVGESGRTELDVNAWYHLSPTATVGASYFLMFPDRGSSFYKNDVLQINGQVTKSVDLGNSFALTPGFRVEYDFPVSGKWDRENTGLYLIPSASLAYDCGNGFNLCLTSKLNWDVYGGYGMSEALVAKIAPSVSYKVGENTAINLGCDFYPIVWRDHEDSRDNPRVFKFGINGTF